MGALHRELQLEEAAMFGLPPRPEPKKKPVAAVVRGPAGLAGVRAQARKEPGHRFAALLHHVDVDLLEYAYRRLGEEGVRGGNGQTWAQYGVDLRANLVRLYTRLQRKRHRTLPSWRKMVAVAQGQRRPLKRAALKDRIVQRAVAEVLKAVYEPDFLKFAGDADPVRCHADALERFASQIDEEKPHWIVEARLCEISGLITPKAMVRCLHGRIADEGLLNLIEQWLKAGMMDALPAQPGAIADNAIAGLLLHVYVHHAFDVWAERWRERHARSAVILVRDSGRLIAGFRHKPGARRFLADLRARARQWAPALPARQLRLTGFRRYAREQLEVRDVCSV